jgi:hypothetical protein
MIDLEKEYKKIRSYHRSSNGPLSLEAARIIFIDYTKSDLEQLREMALESGDYDLFDFFLEFSQQEFLE